MPEETASYAEIHIGDLLTWGCEGVKLREGTLKRSIRRGAVRHERRYQLISRAGDICTRTEPPLLSDEHLHKVACHVVNEDLGVAI